ncbi:histidine kinase HHK6p [Rhodotorula toruloides]|uniref:Histidine kinase HHK6p n=1 Tax=Rhodotorula toruloides TaxID=5286 RepID=A0A511KIW5_RHOTO|nr:histidine kinase HHK6p [Rhodotorula toruloides]
MTRPPPFSRANSSPTFPASASPLPADSREPQTLHAAVLHQLPLPHLVFDSFLRLHALNDAARQIFGVTSGHGGPQPGGEAFPPGGADVFFCVTPEMQVGGGSAADKIRRELDRLAKHQEETFGASEWTWSEGDKVELKSGRVPGLRWTAEAKVTHFVPPEVANDPGTGVPLETVQRSSYIGSTPDEEEELSDWVSNGRRDTVVPSRTPSRAPWYSILLLRPWRETQHLGPSADKILHHRRSFSLDTPIATHVPAFTTSHPSADATADTRSPLSAATSRHDSLALSDQTPTLGSALAFQNSFSHSTLAQRRESNASLAAARAAAAGEPVADKADAARGHPALTDDGATLRLSENTLAEAQAISPGTAAKTAFAGSGGTTSSSGSAGSTGAVSLLSSATATTAATSPPSRRGSGASTLKVTPEAMRGMGISVSSAGIQLSQSTPIEKPRLARTSMLSSTPLDVDESAMSTPTSTRPSDGTTPTLVGSAPMSLNLPPHKHASRPLAYSENFSLASSSSAPSSIASSVPPPLPSPRPTSLPPLPLKPPKAAPDTPALLKFAAIANLPNTGVIIANTELSSGYVNATARELLMGVPASDGIATDSPSRDVNGVKEEWWELGHWSVEDEPWSSVSNGTQVSTASQPFFSPSAELRANPLDANDLTFKSIIRSGDAVSVERGKGTAGSGLRIGQPGETSRLRTTLAGILARSLVSDERKKAALGKGGPLTGGKSNVFRSSAPSPSGLRSPGVESNASSNGSSSTTSGQPPQFIAAGGVGAQGKKPYKVFDPSFGQRMIDPFEPLLEMTARRGQMPPSVNPDDSDEDEDGSTAANGMIVGVEVEVWEADPASTLRQNSFVSAEPELVAQRRKRVRRRILEVTASPIFAPRNDGSKQHLGGVLLVRDVTDDRKRWVSRGELSTKKKKGKEGYFKQILDNLPQLIWTTSKLGSHTYYNKVWYDYTGLEPEQSLGLGWQSPFHPDDMPNTLKAWSHSLETGEPYAVEYRCRRYDGEWRWMLGRALPYRDADGAIQGWFGTCTDFDELYHMREKLRSTIQQNDAVVQGAGCLLIAVDTQYRVTFFEGAHRDGVLAEARVVGRVEGQDYRVLSPVPELLVGVEKVIQGAESSQQVEWQQRQRSYRCLLTPLTEHRDGTTRINGCIIVAHDITDLVSTQARLQQSYEERARLQVAETTATEASRLKSEFLALTSHELRTPIAHMLGLSELLLAEDLTESQKNLASQILRSGDVLLEMIGQVLDMGKVEAGKLDLEVRPFSLNDLSSDARLFATAASKKGLAFIEDVDEFKAPVQGDMPRLRQVLTNLLSNAIKFTKTGSVTLRVKRVREDAENITVRWQVQDTGIGVKREAIRSLFKPFHQADVSTSRQFGGTGLGLSISKNLIELMGGLIRLESEYGVGTTMTVELKLPKMPELLVDQAASTLASDEDIRRDDIWVLVVDDNKLNRDIITRLLIKMGFNVDSVSSGYEALEHVEKKAYDVVLMDHQMDGLDGLETTVRIRQSSNPQVADLKVIALTASALKGDQERFLASGADGYLSKPVRSAVLRSTILRTLQTSHPPNLAAAVSAANAAAKIVSASRLKEVASSAASSELNANSEEQAGLEDSVPSVRRRPSHPSYDEGSGRRRQD